jgi:hypothetical protein
MPRFFFCLHCYCFQGWISKIKWGLNSFKTSFNAFLDKPDLETISSKAYRPLKYLNALIEKEQQSTHDFTLENGCQVMWKGGGEEEKRMNKRLTN